MYSQNGANIELVVFNVIRKDMKVFGLNYIIVLPNIYWPIFLMAAVIGRLKVVQPLTEKGDGLEGKISPLQKSCDI